MNQEVDLAIIGAGPAGMTAALYASRAGLKTVLIDATAPGGKLLKTYLVDNYPGDADIPGPDLAIQMYQQSVSFGASFQNGEVDNIDIDKKVTLKNGDTIQAKAVIYATGTKERLLQIPGEEEAIGHGESFCAVCDGAFYRNKDVVVIGGGNSALEEAQFLAQFASKVTIVIRRDQFRAEKKIQEKTLSNEKVQVIMKSVPVEVKLTDGKVSGVVLKNVDTNETQTIPCSGLFPYIGSTPETTPLKGLDVLDENGYVVVNEKMETSVDGLYAAGDCLRKELRQIVTACADGAIAATQAYHYVTGI